MVWISLSAFREFNNLSDYRGIMSLSNGSSDLRLRDMKDDHGTTPRFNAYLEQHLPHRQTIVVDFNASLYNGRSSHSYTESVSDTPDTDVNTSIRDNNRTISAEADYIKRWDASRFTAGASYTAQRNRSTYANLADKVFRQHQDKIYFFGEYFHRIRRVSLTGGVGAQYTDIRSVNSGKGSSTWNIRPRVSAAWRINSAHQLRLNFTSWQTTPSLSETNEAPQQIDGFQWQIGNPDLSTYSNYRVGLTYNFDIPRVSRTFGVRYERAPHAIAPHSRGKASASSPLSKTPADAPTGSSISLRRLRLSPTGSWPKVPCATPQPAPAAQAIPTGSATGTATSPSWQPTGVSRPCSPGRTEA